ncbi:MAG: DUF1465 domain-containing protein [Hyphomicrobium sp.]|nr:DUF1465 domain-containing protein [Hyphomicrobium sp.]PPC79957.1 MAG: hypothetical protein CTY40_10150 [Hyphomicrobium sp.]
MSSTRVIGASGDGNVTVSFGAHFQSSDGFELVFKEGMGLVERSAAYLDGPGRKEAKTLKGASTVLYATESMRLTTRLLDLASWLLIRRALKEGEITEDEAKRKRQRVKLQSFGRPSHIKGFAELPEGLRLLIEESFKLHDRIVQIDRAMAVGSEPAAADTTAPNPVGHQMSLLKQAFAGKA